MLIVGDVHCKINIVNLVEKHLKDYDKVVFLGDYVDDWEMPAEASYKTLTRLIDLKKKNPEKITLLLGNHDLSEGWGGDFTCSGYKEETHSLVKDLYKTRLDGNVPVFDMAYSKGNFLFTHGGLDERWFEDLKLLLKNHYPSLLELLNGKEGTLACKVANILGYGFLEGLSNPDDKLFRAFGQAGSSRGGLGNPSPLWADKSDLLGDENNEGHAPWGLNQIVGHTPVKTIETYQISDANKGSKQLVFCDTHSEAWVWYAGFSVPIGDNSFLEATFDKKGNATFDATRLDLR